MLCGDGGTANCSAGTPPSNITTLISNANTMINSLFSSTADLTKLKIALIPYVTTVNVGGQLCTGPSTCTRISQNSCSGDFNDYNGNMIAMPVRR